MRNDPNVGAIHASFSTIRKQVFQAGKHKYKAGDYIQTAFSDPEGKIRTENMWVEVKKVKKNLIEGILDNDPFALTHIKCGEKVIIKLEDIFNHIAV